MYYTLNKMLLVTINRFIFQNYDLTVRIKLRSLFNCTNALGPHLHQFNVRFFYHFYVGPKVSRNICLRSKALLNKKLVTNEDLIRTKFKSP